MGETTHQIEAKRPTGESTQGKTTQGEMTHGRNDIRAKRLTTRYRYYSPQVPYITNLFFVIFKNCSRPSATPNDRYFLISNNGNEEEMLVTLNKTFNYNMTLRFKCNAGFILPDMYDSYRICQENKKWS